jgi:hypothetical protein
MLDDETVEAAARIKVDVDRAEDDEEADTIRETSVPRFLDAIVEGIIVEVMFAATIFLVL